MAEKQKVVEPDVCQRCKYRVNNNTESQEQGEEVGKCLVHNRFVKRKEKACDRGSPRKSQ